MTIEVNPPKEERIVTIKMTENEARLIGRTVELARQYNPNIKTFLRQNEIYQLLSKIASV